MGNRTKKITKQQIYTNIVNESVQQERTFFNYLEIIFCKFSENLNFLEEYLDKHAPIPNDAKEKLKPKK